MERAVAYIRVSDQRQADEGNSLNTQKKQVIAYAKERGYDLVHIFAEEGESAKTSHRPQLRELVSLCKKKHNWVQVLVVPKIDRLARNSYDYASIKRKLNQFGVRLESISERIEDTPVGRFTENIMASSAQFDNEIRAERCKGGMVEAVLDGRWVWKAPTGYRNTRIHGKGTIEPDPVTAPLIREAYRLLAYGHQTPSTVQAWLERSGMSVQLASLYKIIRNPLYIGRIEAFGKVSIAKPPFVPLVSEETFSKAGQALATRTTRHGYLKMRGEFVLRGVMICRCGKAYTANWTQGKFQKYGYYRCMECARVNYQAVQVHTEFRTYLDGFKPTPEAWSKIVEALHIVHSRTRGYVRKKRSETKSQVENIRDLQAKIAFKNATGIIPDAVAKQALADLEEKATDALSSVPGAQNQIHLASLLEFAEMFLSSLGQIWEQSKTETKRELLRFLFPNGVLYNPKDGFRTLRNSFQEQLRVAVQTPSYTMVDPNVNFSRELYDWTIRLYNFHSMSVGIELGSGLKLGQVRTLPKSRKALMNCKIEEAINRHLSLGVEDIE
ncbi:MAG: recombinase family protein [Armatimonadetes bacterium]|nr:recombinase family protein [Armatimonadota bacterium]